MLILYYKNYKQSYLGHFSNFFASNFQDNTRTSYNTWLSMKIFGFSLSKNLADKFRNSPTKYNHFPKYFWGPWLKIRPHSCVWNTLINSPWKLEFKILENVRYIPVYNFVWSILEELNCQFSENWHVSCWLMLDTVFHDFTLIVLMIFESSNCVQLTHDSLFLSNLSRFCSAQVARSCHIYSNHMLIYCHKSCWMIILFDPVIWVVFLPCS